MKVFDTGRVANEPEIKMSQGGVLVGVFRIAVDRPWKNGRGEYETDFFNVVCFRETAKFVSQYVSKGALIKLEGDLIIRPFQAQDGSQQRSYEIQAVRVQQLQRGGGGGANRTQLVQDVVTRLAGVPALLPFMGLITAALTPLLTPTTPPPTEDPAETPAEQPAPAAPAPVREPVGAAAAAAVGGFQAPVEDPLAD